MSFYDNLVELCSKNGVKITPTVTSCGGTTGSISGWKRGIWPNSEIVVALAARLSVSTDALLLGKESNTETITSLTASELRLLTAFHSLPTEKQWEEIGRIECLAEVTSEVK